MPLSEALVLEVESEDAGNPTNETFFKWTLL